MCCFLLGCYFKEPGKDSDHCDLGSTFPMNPEGPVFMMGVLACKN